MDKFNFVLFIDSNTSYCNNLSEEIFVIFSNFNIIKELFFSNL